MKPKKRKIKFKKELVKVMVDSHEQLKKLGDDMEATNFILQQCPFCRKKALFINGVFKGETV